MAVSRTISLRSCFRLARTAVARPIHQTTRRQYASGQHAQPNTGSDAMWAAGAVLVTIPSCWYLLSNKSKASDHNHHDEETEVITSEEEIEKDVDSESESAEEESREAHESGIEADKPESIGTEKPNQEEDDYDRNTQTPAKVNKDEREGIKDKSNPLIDEENSSLKNETDDDTSNSGAQESSNMNETSDYSKKNENQLAESEPKSADNSD